jgi:hypothetical protein
LLKPLEWMVWHEVLQQPGVGHSQPFVLAPSQFECPALHINWHTPAAQVAVALVALQTWPQAPQFLTARAAVVGVGREHHARARAVRRTRGACGHAAAR